MASATTNLGLVLPIGTESVSRQIINDNNTAIDTAVGAIPSGKNLQGEIDDLYDLFNSLINATGVEF